MHRLVVQLRVGSDGVLHIDIPMGNDDADREVQVTIDPVRPGPSPRSQQEWHQFVRETAGSWQGELDRPESLEYEQRDELP
jgi:hypothetical protein